MLHEGKPWRARVRPFGQAHTRKKNLPLPRHQAPPPYAPLARRAPVTTAASASSLQRRGACCYSALSALARGGCRATRARRAVALDLPLHAASHAVRAPVQMLRAARRGVVLIASRAFPMEVRLRARLVERSTAACCGADAPLCVLPGSARRPAHRVRGPRWRERQDAVRADPAGAPHAHRLGCVRQP
jgi:hypothetical protein